MGKYRLEWSNGKKEDVDGSLMTYLRQQGYVAYDAGGWEMPLTVNGVKNADSRSGRVALIWETEEESVDDDGSHALAEIIEEEDDDD